MLPVSPPVPSAASIRARRNSIIFPVFRSERIATADGDASGAAMRLSVRSASYLLGSSCEQRSRKPVVASQAGYLPPLSLLTQIGSVQFTS